MKCKRCGINITAKGSEKYGGLCFKHAEEEFNERVNNEAINYGFDLKPRSSN